MQKTTDRAGLGDCPNFCGHRGAAVVNENGTVPILFGTIVALAVRGGKGLGHGGD